MTVRVSQVSGDRRKFNVEMCRDFDMVAVHARWPLTMGVAQGRYYCMCISMGACVCECVCLRGCARGNMCLCSCICTCVHLCVRMCVCVPVCVRECGRMRMTACACTCVNACYASFYHRIY